MHYNLRSSTTHTVASQTVLTTALSQPTAVDMAAATREYHYL